MLIDYVQENGWFVRTESKKPLLSLFVDPTPSERERLVNEFKIDEHNISLALTHDSEASVHMDFSHAALIFKAPLPAEETGAPSFRTTSIGFFLYECQLVVVMPYKFDIFGKRTPRPNSTPATIMLHALNVIIQEFSSNLRGISRAYDHIEEKANRSMDNHDLINLFTLEKGLIYFLSAMNSNAYVFEKLFYFMEKLNCEEDDLAELHSVGIEARRLCKQAEIYSNITASLSSARVSIVSNNLSSLMKNLNLLTIGIMVPTFVVSAFSMNVEIPLQHSQHAFIVVMVLALISVAAFFFYWKLSNTRNPQ
jgi:magnesium transporter